MQVKKEELREKIIKVAEREFVIRGFKESSMRTIAAKSHTTIGNLYHYFESKEAILTAVIGDVPDKIIEMLHAHENIILSEDFTKEKIEANFSEIMDKYMPTLFPLDMLLSNSLIILLEGCEGTKYEHYKDEIYTLFQNHISIHLDTKPDSFLVKTMVHGFVSSLLFISKHKKNLEEGKKDLIQYIKTIVLGFPLPK